MIRSAIFDLGRVLIDFDFDVAIRKLVQEHQVEPLRLFALFRDTQLARKWDRGELSGDEFYSALQKALDIKISQETLIPIWNEIFTEKSEMVRLFHKISESSATVVLSNTNPWHAEYLRANYPWLGQVGKFIASCDVHRMKPDPEIFKSALNLIGAKAEETFYVDDIPEFVESARTLGIDGIVFSDYTSLMDELKKREFQAPLSSLF